MKPESVLDLFEVLVNRGDIEGLVALYEPAAALVERDGRIVKGARAIQDHLIGLLSVKPKMGMRHVLTLDAGDVAVVVSKWQMDGVGSDGAPVTDKGQTYDVVRRQPDGSWRIVVDNPWGTMP